MTWRDYARPIIARVLRETSGLPEAAIRQALRDAYPFGERKMHPYKIWCDEVRVQRGMRRRPLSGRDREQMAMFEARRAEVSRG